MIKIRYQFIIINYIIILIFGFNKNHCMHKIDTLFKLKNNKNLVINTNELVKWVNKDSNFEDIISNFEDIISTTSKKIKKIGFNGDIIYIGTYLGTYLGTYTYINNIVTSEIDTKLQKIAIDNSVCIYLLDNTILKSTILDNTKQINFITSLYAYNNKCPILSIKSNYIIDKSKYNILPYTCKKYNYWESKPIITSHKFIMGTNLYKYNSKYIYFDQIL